MSNFERGGIQTARPIFIRRIRVENLFGYLSYTIPRKERATIDLDRLMILYGDNGCGKTTILTLVFNLLSPLRGRGEKSYIAKTPFKFLEITFDDGSTISASKLDQLIGSFTVVINRPNALKDTFELKADVDGDIGADDVSVKLMNRLSDFGVAMYYLPDDRRIRTTLGSSSDLAEASENVRMDQDFYWNLQAITTNVDNIDDRLRSINRRTATRGSHHLEIASVLEEIAVWFRSHALLGSSAGEENATSIYLRVVEQITQVAGVSALTEPNYQHGLIKRLNEIETRIGAFTRFGLITPFPASKFLSAFLSASDEARRTVATVIEPYVDGIEARLNALDSIRNIILTYVETTNEFLSGKMLEFALQGGAAIRGYRGMRLDPNRLSSGEKQLVLLLSNTILARDTAGIFLIDEPELSLNVKWQRALIDALLKCSEGSKIQYVLASHSLELITQHRRNAVRLSPEREAPDHA